MESTVILGLLGGLALFLYGMHMTSSGLEAAAGNKMKKILERLTSNRFLGILVGALITAAIQSSSAVTVMVVGFVNSKLMTLKQAIWVIMGANIGTTITGQLIALDVGMLAPIFAITGVVMVVFMKKPKFHHLGQILAGLGILFIGMDTMSSAMAPLRDVPEFVNLLTKFSNPVIGILFGAIFTAIIQSSAASIGILQGLAMNGLIDLSNAVFVLFGQNIGTCITAVLASIGTSRNAKRTTIMHLMFNVIGTFIFTILCIVTPVTSLVASLSPDNVAGQIANMHTIFNVATTIILLPFGTQLVKLSTKILPETKDEEKSGRELLFIKPLSSGEHLQLGTFSIAATNVRNELSRMLSMALENVSSSYDSILNQDPSQLEKITEREQYIDYLNKEITKYISDVMPHVYSEADSSLLNSLFKISGDIERIADHATNIVEYSVMLKDKNTSFSESAMEEIYEMKRLDIQAINALSDLPCLSESEFAEITDLEKNIDHTTSCFINNQLGRIRDRVCSDEACVLYTKLLTDFERIGDHALNIAESLANKTEIEHV